jgi:hypothetical protein
MEYNTTRSSMVIPEYGRNIQRMIDYAVNLPAKEERTLAAKTIVNAMAILNPQLRDLTDFKQKLWDHLFVISDFKLDCDSPYPMPEPDAIHARPKRVTYPQKSIKYRNYGSILDKVIKEAKDMEDGPEKQALSGMIANFMKHLFLTYNKDSVNDEVIFEHLREMSGGALEVSEGTKLSAVYIEPKDNIRRNNNNNKRNNNNRKRNGGNRNK